MMKLTPYLKRFAGAQIKPKDLDDDETRGFSATLFTLKMFRLRKFKINLDYGNTNVLHILE